MEELVAIAKIVKPRGLRGEMAAIVLTDFPGRFAGLEDVVGLFPDGTRRDLKLDNAWFQKDRIVLHFDGIDSVDAAEELRDVEICIPESSAAELEADEYFDWQLEGCQVETVGGEDLGSVREVIRTGGTEILAVDGSREFLIPFAASICVEVDIEKKLIRVDPPEGLLEF